MPSKATVKSIAASERWIAEYERMVAANDDAEWAAAQLPFWRNALAAEQEQAEREDTLAAIVQAPRSTPVTTDHFNRVEAERQRVLDIRAAQPGISIPDAEKQARADVAYARGEPKALADMDSSEEIIAYAKEAFPHPFAPEKVEVGDRTMEELKADFEAAHAAEKAPKIDLERIARWQKEDAALAQANVLRNRAIEGLVGAGLSQAEAERRAGDVKQYVEPVEPTDPFYAEAERIINGPRL